MCPAQFGVPDRRVKLPRYGLRGDLDPTVTGRLRRFPQGDFGCLSPDQIQWDQRFPSS
jgi:hypothetical protein